MNARSIKKLQVKFILIATASYLFAMLLMAAFLYGTNLLVTKRQMNFIINDIIQNEGDLPSPRENEEEEHSSTVSLEEVFGLSERDYYSKERQYSTRFFAVIFDENGETEEVKINHISSISEEEAVSYAQAALSRYFASGVKGVYFYKRAVLEDGRTIVVFLNSLNQVATNARLLYTTLFVLGILLLIVLFLMRKLSYYAIQPEIENAKRQEQFITNASHELKTPLAVIRANTEVAVMLHGEDEWTASTLKQVDRMTSLIENLVLISRAQEKSDGQEAILINLSQVLGDTVQSFTPVATQSGKGIEAETGEEVKLMGEEGDFRQLFTLLIDNAIKYCDEGGNILISLTQRGKNQVRLVVSNSYAEGAGVDYNRFFDRFYRQDEAHSIDKGGFGIGLSIVESLVKKYRGKIEVTWKDGMISFTCQLRCS